MAVNNPSRLIFLDRVIVKQLLDRLVVPLMIIVGTFLFGTIGFFVIGAGRWSLLDCAYMTSITLTTVGYGEVLDQMGSDSRIFAMVVMWVGMGVTLYAVSTLTAFVVEKNLLRIFKERQMERRIAALKNHIIVCGAGMTGINIIKELLHTRRPHVVIEGNAERVGWLQEHIRDALVLHGDATEEETLTRAGIERASGIIAALNEDSHNLLITVQARYINPDIKIVARCNETNLTDKFYRAGANYIVNPALIGGMRMASEMIRPHVVAFLDRMLRSQGPTMRVEEVVVGECSPWVGKSLEDADIYRQTGLHPVALKQPDSSDFIYNPPPEEVLHGQTVVIVIGTPDQIVRMREFCSIE